MVIIEAMKLKKRLFQKSKDLRALIHANCAHMEQQDPAYKDLKERIPRWLQSYRDVVRCIGKLQVAIQKTNLATEVEIELDGKKIKKTIAEWVLRRGGKDMVGLAKMDEEAWLHLHDRGLKEQALREEKTGDIKIFKIVRYYDPVQRDKMVDLFHNEPSRIDAKLEIVNATTELVEHVEVNEDKFIA